MGIKFTKIILISLLIIFSSIFITSEAELSQEDDYLSVMYIKDEKDNESEPNKSNVDYTRVTWNLESLFKNDDQWKSELKSFRKDTKELRNYIGKVTKSETHLAFALDIKEKLDIRLNRLCAYPKLKQDINKSSYKYLDMNEEVSKVYKEYSSICSDLELEILKLSDKEYDKFMRNNKINKKYGMYINDIRRNKDHYLDDKEENLLNSASALK